MAITYTEKQKEEILETIFTNIKEGDTLRKALLKVGESEKGLSWTAFYSWIDEEGKEHRKEHYARAIEIRAETMADEIIEIADSIEFHTYVDEKGKTKIDWSKVNRDKLRVDTRKWLMSKMFSKKYSDKSTHVVEGGDKPLKINIDFGEE